MNKITGFILILLAAAFALAATAMAREDHRPYRDAALPDCAECHKSEGVAPNHGGGWLKEHRVKAAAAGSNCYDCHDMGTCQDCHQGGGIDARPSRGQWKRDIEPPGHRSDWISIHPLEARSNPQNCTRCHDTRFCQECHARTAGKSPTVRSHDPSNFPEPHASEARRELTTCQSCHPDGSVCLQCHSATSSSTRVNPHPRNFKGDRIRSRSDRSCRVCHDF
jgi:hypothetical protein